MARRIIYPAFAAGALIIAAPLMAQSGPDRAGADYATDAAGRVYGANLPAMPQPAVAHDAAPPIAHAHAAPPAMDAQRAAWERDRAAWEEDRAAWLDECRARMSYGDRRARHGRDRDHGLGGALIGAAAGGLAGRVIAGDGDRTAGTVIGAVAGAAVGTAIDRSDNAGNRVDERDYRGYREGYRGDYCEQYFDYYTRTPVSGYPTQAYATQMVMVPVAPQAQQPCTETVVTEEWVNVPRRRVHYRTVAPRRHVVPDKRVRIIPDKRVRM